MDVYWIVLIIGGIFMFILSIITIIVLCIFWRRHRISTKLEENTQVPYRQSQIYETQVPHRQSEIYETQVSITILFSTKLIFLFNRKWKYLFHKISMIQHKDM